MSQAGGDIFKNHGRKVENTGTHQTLLLGVFLFRTAWTKPKNGPTYGHNNSMTTYIGLNWFL